MKPFILTTVSLAAELRIMLLLLVHLANNDCAIHRTWSGTVIPTGSMIKGSRPFYWILLKEANLCKVLLKPMDDVLTGSG